MYKNVDPFKCDPPGTFREIIPHPGGHNLAIEKAIIMEHRFAFFFWMKWRRALLDQNRIQQKAPTLVTIDWHRDMAPPSDNQKVNLPDLQQASLSEVANYVWAQFDQTNDGHILCAAWLNLIDDIIVLKHSAGEMKHSFTDINGNKHSIFEFRECDRFSDFLTSRRDQNIFLDIDLDYFMRGQGNVVYPETCDRYSSDEIKTVIDNGSPAFKYMLPHIEGLTIAQEPAYCGGISNSCQIMEIVNNQLFDENNNWRHL